MVHLAHLLYLGNATITIWMAERQIKNLDSNDRVYTEKNVEEVHFSFLHFKTKIYNLVSGIFLRPR